jgi:hypothetical protein
MVLGIRLISSFLVMSLGFAGRSYGQQTKQELTQKLATAMCPVFQQALTKPEFSSLTKAQYQQVINQGFGPVVGKEMAAIRRLYGPQAYNSPQIMNQLGVDVGAQLLQDCPAFITLSARINQPAASTAATTGQTVGKLGELQGTGLAQLRLVVKEVEHADFVWLNHFPGDEDLLRQLASLQGRQARISWQEVELYQPREKHFAPVREITGIELL